MALVLGVIAQKGGVGKSTLVRALAREYAASDWKVRIADMDTQQGTCVDWATRRLQSNFQPEIPVQQFSNVKSALKDRDFLDLIIFDGAPHATNITKDIAKSSDLLILPTGYSTDDLKPTVKLAHELIKEGIPHAKIAIAFSKVGDSDAEAKEARAYINDSGYYLLPGAIPEKVAYRRAMDVGLALTETKFSTLAKKADDLISAIVHRLETADNEKEVQYA
jgi:chromosome partitioning protein